MAEACLRIGDAAPDFTANSTVGPISMSRYKGLWVVFFSHPGDFTPVCTTEFIAFAKAADQFRALNAYLLGLSVDSNPSHLAWLNSITQTTGVYIPFPVIADLSASIADMYGMIAPAVSPTQTVRSVFIIDPKQIIRAILTYPLTNGRSIPEILRLLEALQFTDQYGLATTRRLAAGRAGHRPRAPDLPADAPTPAGPLRRGTELRDLVPLLQAAGKIARSPVKRRKSAKLGDFLKRQLFYCKPASFYFECTSNSKRHKGTPNKKRARYAGPAFDLKCAYACSFTISAVSFE